MSSRLVAVGAFVMLATLSCGGSAAAPSQAGIAAGTAAATASTTPSPAAPATPSATPRPTALPAIVGEWALDQTCQAMVDALNAARKDGTLSRADVAELMRQDLSELVEGVPENGPLPATWDPKHPCADALPPTTHSHTFWADGRFNSYDQTGRQVDDGTWTATTDTLTIGDWSWRYRIDGNRLALDPIVPRTSCTTPDCRFGLGWIFSVAFPGQRWTRVTSGPHVPPESAG